MRKTTMLILLLIEVMSYGQNCTICNNDKLKAKGPNLFGSKTQVKYGTPLCIEVSEVNTFLMRTSSTYTPINFDFSTKGFLDIKLVQKDTLLQNYLGVDESQNFKNEFVNFQKHFSNIEGYTTLKNTLLEQIEKDSIFIGDVQNFKARSTSSYNAIYGSETKHLKQKTKITDELEDLQTSYLNLVSIYQQLNETPKNGKLELSGELKEGNNVLKFNKITATFETKYLFEDEMSKAKVINDKLMQSENSSKMIVEAQAGIDLYDEILNSSFTTTIISDNVYDDMATIKPQLKDSKGKVKYEYREFKVSSYGNWKVNGSAGYFLNFISDDNYTIKKKIETDSNSKTSVVESNQSALKHSLGGLLHAYYNFKGNIDAGFSVGLSINDNANAGFYLGLSAFVIEKNRLVFTSGISFNKIKKLNTTNLKNNSGEYNFTNESDTEIIYDEVYRPSLFIGISYNLF